MGLKKRLLCISMSFTAGIFVIMFKSGVETPASKRPWPFITLNQRQTRTKARFLVELPLTPVPERPTVPLDTYIVFDCGDLHPGPCGGWSDRMSGMFSAYVISVLLKKRFLVTYSRPSNFTDYIIPNSFDWRYNSSILSGRTSSFLNFFCRVPVPIRNKDPKSLGNIFKADVTFVRMNWDYTLHFRRFKSLHKAIPWIFNLQFADIYVKFFNTLFKPVDDIVETINKTLRSVTKLACAHIRMGGNETQDHQRTDRKQLIHIWNFLKTKEDNYSIFIATDSELVRNTAKSLFKQILEVKGRILHIDQNPAGSGVTNGYKKVATDFFLLSKCDVLVLTRSGFGMMSAYLNTNNPSLYCLVKDEVVPCSRYTLHNYYPGEILSPY